MRRTILFAVALLTGATGCNELLNIGRFTVDDGGVTPSDGGMDASVDAGRVDAGPIDAAGLDAGPPDAGPCNEDDPDGDDDGHDSMACGGDDCDDSDETINPSAVELCDDIDQDCDGATLGPDEDGDGSYALGCCNGGRCGDDCDDSDETVEPGATETCDDVDQDCDGTIDEGLIGLLGGRIVVDDDYGSSGQGGVVAVAHSTGFAVLVKDPDVGGLVGSFYRRDGTAYAVNQTIESGTRGAGTEVRTPRAALLTRDGLEQIVVVWTETGATAAEAGVFMSLCETDGSDCTFDRDIETLDPTTIDDLAVRQIGRRILVQWVDSAGLQLRSVDPSGLTPNRTRVIPLLDGDPETSFGGPVYVDGPEPFLWFSRVEGLSIFSGGSSIPDGGVTLDGGAGTYVFGRSQGVRVRDPENLAFDASMDVFELPYPPACAAVGTAFCSGGVGASGGDATLGQPTYPTQIIAAGFDSLDGGPGSFTICLHGSTPVADGPPELGACQELPSLFGNFVDRGTVATALLFIGSRYNLREFPLSPEADGSGGLTPIPDLDFLLPGSNNAISVHGGHGVLVGNDGGGGFDVTAQRIGCAP